MFLVRFITKIRYYNFRYNFELYVWNMSKKLNVPHELNGNYLKRIRCLVSAVSTKKVLVFVSVSNYYFYEFSSLQN